MKSAMAEPVEERKGRGRPRAFDHDAALRAAMMVFWRHGFDGTSYTDLTAATGMSKPTLYAMFGDKVELFRAAVVEYSEASMKVYREALDLPAARDAVEAGLRLARGLAPTAGEPIVCFLVQGALTGSADTQVLRDELTELRRQATEMLRDRLERAKREGELPKAVNAGVLAEFYASLATGLSVQAQAGADVKQLNDVVTMAMAQWPGK